MSLYYDILIKKLNLFIKRFYKNQIIKGIILLIGVSSFIFILFNLLEHFGWFSSTVRKSLLYFFVISNAVIFIKYIFVYVLKLYKVGRSISKEEAARLIGKHFDGIIDDKIVNVLQLKKFLEEDNRNIDLLVAGINQKSETLVNVSFERIIKYGENLRHVALATLPVVLTIALLLLTPFIIIESTNRIINYDNHFIRPAPFEVIVLNRKMQSFQNTDFLFEVEVKGNVLPDNLKIKYNGKTYLMKKKNNNLFNYNFQNLQKNKRIYLEAGGLLFGPHDIQVVPRPIINNFEVIVISPEYTRIEDKNYINYGDVSVAEGSVVRIIFNTRFSDGAIIKVQEEYEPLNESAPGIYNFEKTAYESFSYRVFTKNQYTEKGDSLSFSINTVKDQYPEIYVREYMDTILLAHRFFTGQIRDDYGFSGLKFKYDVKDNNEYDNTEFETVNIPIDKRVTNQTFNYHFDINEINIKPGQTIEYYFAVWDNDGINGPKKSTTNKYTYRIPAYDEIAEKSLKEYSEITDELSVSGTEMRKSRDEIEELKIKLLEKEKVGWEEREAFKKLIEKHEEFNKKIEELAEKKKKGEERYEQFQEQNDNIKKMQEDLQRIFDEAQSDELKDLFDKIKNELDMLNRDQIYEMIEKIDQEFRHNEQQLERVLELFKMLEFQNILQESINFADRLKNEQEGLLEEIKGIEKLEEYVYDEQKEIVEGSESLHEMLEKLRQKNSELSRPQKLPDTRDVQHNIQYDLNKALEQIIKNNLKNTIDYQDKTVEGLNELLNTLSNFQSSLFQQDLAEDSRLVRQLLENLIKSSFNQEDLMKEVRKISINDPRYTEKIQEQRKIHNDLKIVEDSLIALSKRQIHVRSFINREISEINMNIDKAIPELINRRRHSAISRQQFVMTHINNLALMLNESLQDMQMQMAMQMGGEGEPQQGGGAELGDMIDMQKAVNEMLEKLRQGYQPIPGESGEQMSLSEQLARMSLQQEMVRNQLRKLSDELKRDHRLSTKDLDEIQREMERTELDIITNRINRQTMIRQERILTRLLEHEKAMMERDFAEEREGKVPEFYDLSNPEDFFEYNRIRNQQIEMLKTNQIYFNRFYNNLIEMYFIKFKE